MSDTESEYSEEYYEELFKKTDDEFPDCDFNISIFNKLEDFDELDKSFTEEKTILIKDDRTSASYFFSDLTKDEKSKYIHYTTVKQINNKPITLRQILNAMCNDEHYKMMREIQCPHNFLEGFDKTNNLVYEAGFGS